MKLNTPFVVGITGGIGAGKSSVAAIISHEGFPVYNSDNEAKNLMNTSPELKNEIVKLLGEKAYKNNILDRKYVAEKVFNSPKILTQLNAIVHPAVKIDFENWAIVQKTSIVFKEAAILFESNAYQSCDAVLVVTADEEIRINRVLHRENSTREEVLKRMKNQWTEEAKIKLSDFVIYNNASEEILEKRTKEIIEQIKIKAVSG